MSPYRVLRSLMLRGCGGLVGLGASLLLRAAEPAVPADAVSGEAMRVLRAQCFACHNDDKHRGGLVLTSPEGLAKGGDEGPAVVAGDPEKSRLIALLAADADPHMPPKKQLNAAEAEALRAWVAGGARWNAARLAELDAPRPVTLTVPTFAYTPAQAVALSPDARHFAVGQGTRLHVGEVTGTNLVPAVSIQAHTDVVRALAWSPDGRRIASAGFRELTLWDSATLERVWTVSTNLLGRVSALRFSPHGGALLVADGNATESGWVRVLSAETGATLSAWKAHSDTVFDLALTPEAGLVATAGGDKLIKVWELVSQREVARLEGHLGAVYGVAFSTNAHELVSVAADKQLKLWDLNTREAVVTIGGRRFALNSAAWARDGSRVVASDDEGRLYSFSDFKRHTGEQSSATANEQSLGQWTAPQHAVAVSADGRTILVGGEDGRVRQVGADGKLLATLEPPALGTNAATPALTATEPVPSFVYDVLPVLAKAGCSAGACHAKPEGQNGFKLSVFSYDPAADYQEILSEARGRRVFPAAPDESLLLLKPTGRVDHGGGVRFATNSAEYALIRRWIATGLTYQRTNEPSLVRVTVSPRERSYVPGEAAELHAEAAYSDGTTRDITALAEYLANDKEIVQVDDRGRLRVGKLNGEGVVVARFAGLVDAARITVPATNTLPAERYARLPTHNFIDTFAYQQFRKLGLFPSELSSDAEFLRRAYLDTLGILPTTEEAREFLQSSAPDATGAAPLGREQLAAQRARRATLIDQLLARPEFGDFWANKWADLVRPNSDRVGVKSVYTLDQWLRAAMRANTPYDQLVREVLLAEGSNHRDGPVVIYRDRREPPELTTMFSQLFLGVRLECAKCHHHPNEKWSQDDFYQFAAVFGPLKQKGAGLSPPISAGVESFYFGPGGSVRHPVTGKEMTPRPPDGPVLTNGAADGDPRRAFADWLTKPGNPFFARAAVNRVWAAFFGRGFVDPVDDLRVSNPAVHPELFAALAEDFERHGYDLKHLMRTILNSRLYQLSSTPNDTNLGDTRNFSRSYRRRLPAEVLLDAVNDITGVTDDFNGCPPGTRAMQTWSYKVNSQFLDAFGRPNSSSDCPCERDARPSVVQSLHLMNSRRLHEKLRSPEGRLKQWADSARAPEELVRDFYLTTLSRFPTADECATAAKAFTGEGVTRASAGEDVLWALLNSAEFVFNH